MFVRREFDWLKHQFREYDLVYLDPLVCDPALRKSYSSRWTFWRSGKKSIESFLGRLIKSLGIRPEDTYPSYFLEYKGFGTRFRSDRILQRHVARVINQHLDEVTTRHYHSAASLQGQKASLEKIADRLQGESLIIVDAMLSTRAGAPEEIQQVVQAPVQHLDNSMRSIECMFTDSPGPLLTLCDPVIGLMVDEHVFYNWTGAFRTILSVGWYPFARTVGLYSTSPGGHPFINVIAILMRPYPSLDEVLEPSRGKPARCSLPGMLEYLLENSLEPEIERLKNERQKSKKTVPASAGTSAVTSKRVYDRDEQFLSPVYLFLLFCQLNRTSWQGLRARANYAYQVLQTYLERLELLGKCLEDLGIESQIPPQETGVRELLPEPEPH